MLKQGDSILFDTGFWKTEGSAYTTDLIDLEEWGPDKETTFQFLPQDTNNSGTYNNKSYYCQFGLADDGSNTELQLETLQTSSMGK